jgi:hypothetical protein
MPDPDERFVRLHFPLERAGQFGVVALDIPPDADHRAVKDLLRVGEADGRWGYEEACVTDAWLAL